MELKDLYERIDKLELLKELNARRSGGYIALDCPACKGKGKGRAFIYNNGGAIICNRKNECGQVITLWDYVKEKYALTTNAEVYLKLAELAGVPFGSIELNRDYIYKLEKDKEKQQALKEFHSLTKALLFQEYGQNTLTYLTQERGYSESEIKSTGLGYYPPNEVIKNKLSSQSFEFLEQDGFFKDTRLGRTHTLAIAYITPLNEIEGFIVRAIGNYEPKYINTAGLKKDYFFNDKGRDEIIIVEGQLDALILQERLGLEAGQVVATAGGDILEKQIKNTKAKIITLALDTDEAGQRGTQRAIDLLLKHKKKIYICETPKEYKDPDALLKSEGIDKTRAIINKPLSLAQYKAKKIIADYGQTQNISIIERDKLIDAIIKDINSFIDPIDIKDYKDIIYPAFNLNDDLLKHRLETYEAKQRKEQEAKIKQEAMRILQARGIGEAQQYLSSELAKVKGKLKIDPYTYTKILNVLTQEKEGLKTGITDIDNKIILPNGAITIVAGRPSHGKTSLLLNLFVNMCINYSDKKFYFFTYEEGGIYIALKTILLLAGDTILPNTKLDFYKLKNYLKHKETLPKETENKIIEAKQKFFELTETTQTMNIIAEPLEITSLTNYITHLADNNDIGAVFIDYIQKIPTQKTYSTRQAELQAISASLLATANAHNIPMVLGAQFKRPDGKDMLSSVSLDNLREAGDIEQDANLVLGLFNNRVAQAEAKQITDNNDTDTETRLDVYVLKNRYGAISVKPIALNFTHYRKLQRH